LIDTAALAIVEQNRSQDHGHRYQDHALSKIIISVVFIYF